MKKDTDKQRRSDYSAPYCCARMSCCLVSDSVYLPLSQYFTADTFDMLVSKFAISGAIYCVAASHECTYSPV